MAFGSYSGTGDIFSSVVCGGIVNGMDVFDAVSEKRCYRDAMPLEKSFAIISEGSGQDFDPLIAEVFLEMKDKVEQIHSGICTKR